MAFATSPLAPKNTPLLPEIRGIRFAAGNAAIKQTSRPDVVVFSMSQGTVAAGVFTTSLTASAPVHMCRKNLAYGEARALIVNSGNSNAFTGSRGEAAMHRVISAMSKQFDVPQHACFMASTGVIGQVLPDEKLTTLLPTLTPCSGDWLDAARAIMTTDTFPKLATRSAMIGDVKVTLNGIAKGSGMIAPDMATMLAFVFTDAAIAQPALQALLSESTRISFNAITVDGDTSTSDTLMLFATGKAGNATNADMGDFASALTELLTELAQWVVKDGEGASKFITVHVRGAEHDTAARSIGMSIANSPLVKTAVAGGDANWGRIVMAVGKAGQRAERDRLSIYFGTQCAAKNGELNPDYDDNAATEYLKGDHIDITVDVGVGRGEYTVWTCDLTHGYIDINGAYRT